MLLKPQTPMLPYTALKEDIARDANNFSYHPPLPGQAERYQAIRATALGLVTHLRLNCPPSRELSLALTKIEEAVFWANSSIARNEKWMNSVLEKLAESVAKAEDPENALKETELEEIDTNPDAKDEGDT